MQGVARVNTIYIFVRSMNDKPAGQRQISKSRKMKSTETIKGIEIPVVKCLVIAGTKFVVSEVALKETEKAILVNVCNTECGSNHDYWMPKSLINYTTDKFGAKQMLLPEWYLRKMNMLSHIN